VSVLRLAFERRSIPDLPDTYGQPGFGWWGNGMTWHPGSNGTVSTDQAMRLSAVFACLRLLSEAVATLPLETFTRRDEVRFPVPRPPYLAFAPPQQSRIDYLSQVMLSLLTDGNAYVLTPRDEMGEPVDLVVLDPGSVTVERKAGRVTYTCQDVRMDPRFDVMHIKGMMLPGEVKGLSPIAYARETITLGLSAQRYGTATFDNMALPAAVIQVPEGRNFSNDAAIRFRETWNANHRGPSNANRVGVLTGGAELKTVSINPEDAQFLETRQFQVPDVARIFGVPPHLIADASNSTSWGSGLAEQNLAFGSFSLRPWVTRIENSHDRLLSSHGRASDFVKLNLDALLRASLKDQLEALSIGIENRIYTSEEGRALQDLPPLPAKVDTQDIEAAGALIRAGFDPADALRVLGLPPIKHTGSLPITVQPEDT
jgi:HK97 family phage portal protein